MQFATVDDFKSRYGAFVADEAQLDVLLQDASNMLLTEYERFYGTDYVAGAHPTFDRSACAVCCAMVKRIVDVPDGFAGATQYSQGAGGYTASVSFSGALGDMYLGKSDLKRLGLSGSRIGAYKPIVRSYNDEFN